MPYSLRVPYNRFASEIEQLDTCIRQLAELPEGVGRDTHIEGCFIRFAVRWEQFVEEYVLRCLCGAMTRSKRSIRPRHVSIRTTREAFTRLNAKRQNRDKDYIDWLDAEALQKHVGDHFRANSRVRGLCEAPDQLYQLKVIRNAIAHGSVSAITKFEKFVKDQLGYLASLNPTVASLLVQKRRGSNALIFTILSDYFLSLADRLTR